MALGYQQCVPQQISFYDEVFCRVISSSYLSEALPWMTCMLMNRREMTHLSLMLVACLVYYYY
jgi:hypothetical protein